MKFRFAVSSIVFGLMLHMLLSIMPIMMGPVQFSINPLPEYVYMMALVVLCCVLLSIALES